MAYYPPDLPQIGGYALQSSPGWHTQGYDVVDPLQPTSPGSWNPSTSSGSVPSYQANVNYIQSYPNPTYTSDQYYNAGQESREIASGSLVILFAFFLL